MCRSDDPGWTESLAPKASHSIDRAPVATKPPGLGAPEQAEPLRVAGTGGRACRIGWDMDGRFEDIET